MTGACSSMVAVLVLACRQALFCDMNAPTCGPGDEATWPAPSGHPNDPRTDDDDVILGIIGALDEAEQCLRLARKALAADNVDGCLELMRQAKLHLEAE